MAEPIPGLAFGQKYLKIAPEFQVAAAMYDRNHILCPNRCHPWTAVPANAYERKRTVSMRQCGKTGESLTHHQATGGNTRRERSYSNSHIFVH